MRGWSVPRPPQIEPRYEWRLPRDAWPNPTNIRHAPITSLSRDRNKATSWWRVDWTRPLLFLSAGNWTNSHHRQAVICCGWLSVISSTLSWPSPREVQTRLFWMWYIYIGSTRVNLWLVIMIIPSRATQIDGLYRWSLCSCFRLNTVNSACDVSHFFDLSVEEPRYWRKPLVSVFLQQQSVF